MTKERFQYRLLHFITWQVWALWLVSRSLAEALVHASSHAGFGWFDTVGEASRATFALCSCSVFASLGKVLVLVTTTAALAAVLAAVVLAVFWVFGLAHDLALRSESES